MDYLCARASTVEFHDIKKRKEEEIVKAVCKSLSEADITATPGLYIWGCTCDLTHIHC